MSKSTSYRVRKEAETLIPDLSGITYAEIHRATGISQSMLSRMFTDDPAQKRPNPTLDVLLTLRNFLQTRTGRVVTLDDLADAIR